MKRSYKLIGVLWDGKTIPQSKPEIKRENLHSTSSTVINLSEIYKMNDKKLMKLKETDYDAIVVDFVPKISIIYMNTFFTKRMLQIVDFFKAGLMCNDEETEKKVNDLLTSFY